MKELFNIEKLIAIRLCIFISLLLSVLFVIPISANPIDREQTCRSYSFFNAKNANETSFKVTENDLASCCQNENDLLNYRDWGRSIEAAAATTSTLLWTSTSKMSSVRMLLGIGRNTERNFQSL